MLAFIAMTQCNLSQGADVVSLDPYYLPKVGLDEDIQGFLDSKPFTPYLQNIAESLSTNRRYNPLYGFVDGNWAQFEESNITATVVGRISDVRLIFVSASNSNVTAYLAWYVATVSVIETRKGDCKTKEFSFLFNDTFPYAQYVWPYLPALVYAFDFAGNKIVRNRPLSRFPPYRQDMVKEWSRFRQDYPDAAQLILDKWVPTQLGKVVNIHLENDDYVVISSVNCYSVLGDFIRNYNDVIRTIISLKTKDVVDEKDFIAFKADALTNKR